MVFIVAASVPLHLQCGILYSSLDPEGDGFEIPKGIADKFDMNLQKVSDLHHLLSTLRFWGVDEVPLELIHFVCSCEEQQLLDKEIHEFEKELDYLPHVTKLRNATDKTSKGMVAVMSNRLEVLQYCLQHGVFELGTPSLVHVAIRNGCSVSVAFLTQHFHLPWTISMSVSAAEAGQLVMLQLAHEQKGPWDETVLYAASAVAGSLSCVEYLHAHGCPWDTSCSDTCDDLAAAGHFDCLRFAHERGGVPLSAETATYAALRAHMPMLQYLRSRGCDWDKKTLVYAIGSGCLEVVQYCYTNGCPRDPLSLVTAAAHAGFKACIAYLLTQGEGMDEDATCAAAAQGLLPCLRYLREEVHCPWGEDCCMSAARHGHAEVLRYALEQGCPAPKKLCALAARYGHMDCVSVAETLGCAWASEEERKFWLSVDPGEKVHHCL
jgi:hypothetical protein